MQSQQSPEELYANLTFKDEEEWDIIMKQNEVIGSKQTIFWWASFWQRKMLILMRCKMSCYRCGGKKGMKVNDLGGFIYTFLFFHKMDVQIVRGRPVIFWVVNATIISVERG